MTVVGEGSDGATMARYNPHLNPNLRRDPRLERSPHRRRAPIYGVRFHREVKTRSRVPVRIW